MEYKVEMEDGSFEMVADCFVSKDLFRLHQWGNIWLVATLTDDVKLIGDDSSEILMGDLRKLEAGVTTTVKSGGELRRTRSFKGKKGIVLDARPFRNKK